MAWACGEADWNEELEGLNTAFFCWSSVGDAVMPA